MANTSGKTIEIPIKANFREGLSVLEYFVSSRGARKGLADTALRTADSGYLTRRLVDVSQEVIIREEDCGTANGIWASAVYEKGQEVQSFGVSIHGRYPAVPVTDPATGEVIFDTHHMLMSGDAATLTAHGIDRVLVRSVLTCEAATASAPHCYGINLAIGSQVNPGEARRRHRRAVHRRTRHPAHHAYLPHRRHRRRRHHQGLPGSRSCSRPASPSAWPRSAKSPAPSA